MTIVKGALSAVLVVLGAVLMYFGQIDDSPGLGGIGLILIVAVFAWWARHLWAAKSKVADE